MLNVNTNILDKIGIQYCFVVSSTGQYFISIREMWKRSWKFSVNNISGSQHLLDEGLVELNIRYKDDFIREPATVQTGDNNVYTLNFGVIQDERLKEIKSKIEELEKKEKEYTRRKEERYSVGIDNSIKFGLKQPEQKILDKDGKEHPAVIGDVSFSGMKVITTDSETFENGENICVILNCYNSSLLIKGQITHKNVVVSDSSAKTRLATLSIHLTENLIEYKTMVDNYSTSLKEKIMEFDNL